MRGAIRGVTGLRCRSRWDGKWGLRKGLVRFRRDGVQAIVERSVCERDAVYLSRQPGDDSSRYPEVRIGRRIAATCNWDAVKVAYSVQPKTSNGI